MIDQLAGLVGVDPGPLTLRRLLQMAEGLQQAWWDHDAWVCHVIANVQRDPDTAPILPAQLNPLLMHAAEQCGGGIELDPITIRAIAKGLRERKRS